MYKDGPHLEFLCMEYPLGFMHNILSGIDVDDLYRELNM